MYLSFIDNIWGGDLDDMQLISKFNKGIRFLYIHGLFLWKIKKALQLLLVFKK